MRRSAILLPLLLATITVVLVFGVFAGDAGASTPTRYEQNAPQLLFSSGWGTSSVPEASGGSYRYANNGSRYVAASFKGTSLAWIAKKGPTYGKANVYLDGRYAALVDLFNDTIQYQQRVWDTGALTSGLHSVRIEWTGERHPGAPSAIINVDAFDVVGTLAGVTRLEQTDDHIGWLGNWLKASAAAYSGGNAWYTNSSGGSATIQFDGANLALIGKKGPTYGIANVSVDNGPAWRVDLYNPTTVYKGTIFSIGLTPGLHWVKVSWTGQKNPAATGTNVGLDAVDVRGALVTAAGSDLAFNAKRAMQHLAYLVSTIGVRHGGSPEEQLAVDYAVKHFKALGYTPVIQDVPLPDGKTSHNVIVTKPGTSRRTVVVGAHMDSFGPSPGGNDNGSGSATVLELAQAIKDVKLVPTVTLILFGHEEPMGDGNADHHHYGSRLYAALMTNQQRADLAAMISLDMVGYGTAFKVRYRERGPRTLVNMILNYSARTGAGIAYMKDPSTYGYSDHEAFEALGYPVSWIEWRADPVNHTSGDNYAHCSASKIQQAGSLVLGFLASLRGSDLQALVTARN